MPKKYTADPKLLSFAYKTVKNTKSTYELKRALCVILCSELQFPAKKVAHILQISIRKVYRYREELRNISRGCRDKKINWGG